MGNYGQILEKFSIMLVVKGNKPHISCDVMPFNFQSTNAVGRSYFPPLLNLALDARDYLHVLAIVPEAQRPRYTLDRKLDATRAQREVPAWNRIRVVHLLPSRFYALS
jgi:hypothetical protein